MIKEEILGALARGYCSKENGKRVLDPVLCFAIAAEIEKLLNTNTLSSPK